MPKARESLRMAFRNFFDICKFVYYLELGVLGGTWWLICTPEEEILCKVEEAYKKAFGE